MKESEKPHEQDTITPNTDRKPYQAPTLTEYGLIAKLTLGKTGSVSDGKRARRRARAG